MSYVDEHLATPVPNACDCDHGWRTVSHAYAEGLARQKMADGQTEPDPPLVAALVNSVYPCRDCRPRMFFRWAEGHWHPDHDTAACDQCTTTSAPRRREGPRRADDTPPIGEPPGPPVLDDPTRDRY